MRERVSEGKEGWVLLVGLRVNEWEGKGWGNDSTLREQEGLRPGRRQKPTVEQRQRGLD